MYAWYSPTGLVSKNNIGARRIALNILLCKLRDAFRHVIKPNNPLNTVIINAPERIAPYIPILWRVVKSKSDVSFSEVLASRREQDSPSLALGNKLNLIFYSIDAILTN